MDEQHEVSEDTIEVARETMHGDLMRLVVDVVRAAPDAWDRLPEHKQQEVIDRIDQCVGAVIASCVQLIATDNRPCITAVLKEMNFKDGIKAVLGLSKLAERRHELADNVGSNVYIVIPSVIGYSGGQRPKASPNQASLPLDEAQAEQAHGAALEEAAQSMSVAEAHAVKPPPGPTRPFVITPWDGTQAFGAWAIDADDAYRIYAGKIEGAQEREKVSVAPGEETHMSTVGCINPMDSPRIRERAERDAVSEVPTHEKGKRKAKLTKGEPHQDVAEEQPDAPQPAISEESAENEPAAA